MLYTYISPRSGCCGLNRCSVFCWSLHASMLAVLCFLNKNHGARMVNAAPKFTPLPGQRHDRPPRVQQCGQRQCREGLAVSHSRAHHRRGSRQRWFCHDWGTKQWCCCFTKRDVVCGAVLQMRLSTVLDAVCSML